MSRSAVVEPSPSTSAQVAYSTLVSTFDRALAAVSDSAETFFVLLGGKSVRFRICGHALAAAYRRVFQHLLTTESTTPDLTVDLVEAQSTGIADPVVGPISEPGAEHPGAWHFRSQDSRFFGTYSSTFHAWLDLEEERIVGWVAGVDLLSHEEKGKSLLRLLPYWFEMHNTLWMHAGAVARTNRSVLICGPGGSGKSTTSIACVLAGFEYLGDDFTLVDLLPDGRVQSHSLYSTGQLFPEQLARFPAAAKHRTSGVSFLGKPQVFLAEVPGVTMRRSATVAALVLPVICDHETTTFRRSTRGESLRRLLLSNVQFPYIASRRDAIDRISQTIERVPTYWLECGRDLSTLAPAVDHILAEVQ